MTTSLIKYSDEKIRDNTQLQKFIAAARREANVIFPESLPFSDTYTRLGVEVVTVDPNNTNHAYKNESGGYCLHLSKLNEIAKAAKIRVVDSAIQERKTDENGRVTFISHQVKVQYRTVAGEMITEAYTGKYDYYNDKETKKEGQVKSRRKHAEALAESNALYRAFGKVLPQLSSSLKLEELKKPFLIPYVEEDREAALKALSPEEQNAVKKERARKALGLMDAIYSPPAAIAESSQVEDATVVEEEKPVVSKEEEIHLAAESFRDAPQSERTEKILNLIKIKGYEDPQKVEVTAKRIENNSVDAQIGLIEKLLNLEDCPDEVTL